MDSLMQSISPLSLETRLEARDKAKTIITQFYGMKPIRDQFERHTDSQYPVYITRIIILLCFVALVAAFTPSAIRLYHIGSTTFRNAIDHQLSAQLVGLAVVIMAEVSQLVFSLSLAVLGTSKISRNLLYFSMTVATAIALIGNIQVALPDHWMNPFSWLEAVAPPILVLTLAYILKEQILIAIQQRHSNERAYQQALAEWQQATAEPDQHARWQQVYANALRDAIIKANKHRRKVNLSELTPADWFKLIQREMRAENWFELQERNSTDSSDAHPPVQVLEEGSDTFVTIPLASVNGSKAH